MASPRRVNINIPKLATFFRRQRVIHRRNSLSESADIGTYLSRYLAVLNSIFRETFWTIVEKLCARFYPSRVEPSSEMVRAQGINSKLTA